MQQRHGTDGHLRHSAQVPFVVLVVLGFLTAAMANDWPQWGGQDCRNMVSDETGLPEDFKPGERKGVGEVDLATTKNVRWVAHLGTACYGNPTIAGGRVFVGTDDATVTADPRLERTRGGMVKCFDEATGKLLWQLATPERTRLPKDILFGHQYLGTCSSPTVEGDRVYVVTSAAEIVCLDVHGQANGNDGPYLDESRYLPRRDEKPLKLGPTDGDIIWRYDLMDEAGVIAHDAASCSVLLHGNLLYAVTSNGVDAPHAKMLAPDAPALIALDKRTGRLAAREDIQLSRRLYHAEWSSPSLGTVNGRPLLFLGGGDGVCYAFDALATVPAEPVGMKAVWSYDCNPPQYKFRDGKLIPYYEGDKRKPNSPNKNDGTYLGPSQIIATPVFHNNRVYIGIGQDPAHGRGKGLFHCIDATKTGDITASGRVWTYDGLDRTIATAAVANGLVYITDIAGRLHCLDADNGRCYWVHETKAETWGGPLVADGKLYFGNKKSFYIMAEGREAKVLSEIRLGAPVYSTTVVANGTVYVASQNYLWAVQKRP